MLPGAAWIDDPLVERGPRSKRWNENSYATKVSVKLPREGFSDTQMNTGRILTDYIVSGWLLVDISSMASCMISSLTCSPDLLVSMFGQRSTRGLVNHPGFSQTYVSAFTARSRDPVCPATFLDLVSSV